MDCLPVTEQNQNKGTDETNKTIRWKSEARKKLTLPAKYGGLTEGKSGQFFFLPKPFR